MNHGSACSGLTRVRGPQFLLEHGFSRRRLSAYVDGELNESERGRVARHLEECPECADTSASLERLVTGLALLGRYSPSLLTARVCEALQTRIAHGEAARD